LYFPKEYHILGAKFAFIKRQIDSENVVLDLGCARGDITEYLASISKFAVGIDHNALLIAEAMQRHCRGNLKYFCGDAIDYVSNSETAFDILILSHILEHLDEPVQFLKNYLGRFEKIFIEVPDNDQDEHSHLRVACGLKPLFNDADHIWEFRRDDMLLIFKTLKLTILESDYSYGVMRFWLRSPRL
jgi:SAM-dependent methyltransferase